VFCRHSIRPRHREAARRIIYTRGHQHGARGHQAGL